MANDQEKRKLKAPLEALNKYKYVLLVALLGAVLLLWPSGRDGAEAVLNTGGAEGVSGGDVAKTEQAMEEILGKISGVGKVDVMLTLQTGGEKVLAQDSSLRYSGPVQSPDSYERSAQPVTDSGGVVVTQEKLPLYRGALIVCEGGGNDAVRLQVIEAVAALTGLGSDRIAVVKWQGTSSVGSQE